MIFQLLRKNLEIVWILFHVVLGLLGTITPWSVIAWLYFLVGSSIVVMLLRGEQFKMHFLLAYVCGVEILCRMSGTSPWVPWEMGKYLTPVLIIFSFIFEQGRFSKWSWGIYIVLLSIPAWIIGNVEFDDKVFSMLGIINLGLMVMYFMDREIEIREVEQIFKMLLYPLISVLAFIIIKSPALGDIEFKLGGNHATTAGFGTNQVSTMLGIGFLVLSVGYFLKFRIFKWKLLEVFLLCLFLFRGLLSFSRGGVLISIFALISFIAFSQNMQRGDFLGIKIRKIKIQKLILAFLLLFLVGFVGNEVSNGALLLRYKGETSGTLEGTKEKTLNTITTNRWNIVVSDLEIWFDHPILGVGGGNSGITRQHYGMGRIVAHTELSRLLSEQGFLGLIIICLLLFTPLASEGYANRLNRALLICFWILAIGTSFHAAMRTMVTPFFFGLCLIKLIPNKRLYHIGLKR